MSDLVGNPKDWVSHVAAQMYFIVLHNYMNDEIWNQLGYVPGSMHQPQFVLKDVHTYDFLFTLSC